jgi:hypothetical protein
LFCRRGAFALFEARERPFALRLFDVVDAVANHRPIDYLSLTQAKLRGGGEAGAGEIGLRRAPNRLRGTEAAREGFGRDGEARLEAAPAEAGGFAPEL